MRARKGVVQGYDAGVFDYTKSPKGFTEVEAAPEGLNQRVAARNAEAQAQGLTPWEFASQKNADKVAPSYAKDARSWFGGRNVEGTNSGWDTTTTALVDESYNTWLDKVSQSRKEKDPAKWLSTYDWLDAKKNPGGANGVAYWDDPGEDLGNGRRGPQRYKRGDLVKDGVAVQGQNVYDVHDRATADLIMAPFLFSASEQARFSRDSNPAARFEREVKNRMDEFSRAAEGQAGALEYQADVFKAEQDILSDGRYAVGLTGAGALATAAPLAATGFAVGGPMGAAVLGGAGLLVGGISSWLNRDALAESLAMGRVQADRAGQKYGSATEFAATITEWSGVSRKLISPFSNLVQGGYDAFSEGGIGDGNVHFQEVTEDGQRVAPLWIRGFDLAGTLADGVLQFATPIGRVEYMTTMTGSIAGQVGTFTTTALADGGDSNAAGFNVRTGQWDEYEGKEWVYALGGIGIDALQLGVGAMIGRAKNLTKEAFDLDAGAGRVVVREEGLAGKLGAVKRDKDGTPITRPMTDAELAAARSSSQTIGGFKFDRNAAGEVVSKRATATAIVPSEFVKWVATSWLARTVSRAGSATGTGRALVGSPGASVANRWVDPVVRSRVGEAIGHHMPGPDDYYRAALKLSSMESTFGGALLNGFAEGWEEAIQAILEPASFSEQIHGGDVLQAAVYGMASGVGMGIGGRSTNAAHKQESRAQALYMVRKQIDRIDRDEWNRVYWGQGVTDSDRQRMAIASTQEAKTINERLGTFKRLHQRVQMGSVIPITIANSIRQKKFEQLQRNRNPNIEGSRVLMGRGDEMVAANGQVEARDFKEDAAVQSLEQTVIDLKALWKGQKLQQQALEADLARWSEIALQSEAGSDQLQEAQAKVQAYTERLAKFPALNSATDQISTNILREFENWNATNSARGRQQIIDRINRYLSDAFEGRLKDSNGQLYPKDQQPLIKEAVELRIARHPVIDEGASEVFRPQVSSVLTDLGQNATTYIHQGVLKKMQADHDGDQGVLLGSQYLPEDQLNMLRSGAHYLRTVVEEKTLYKMNSDGTYQVDAKGKRIVSSTYQVNRVEVITDPADGHKSWLEVIYDALADTENTDRRDIAQAAIDRFEDRLKQRYVAQYSVFTDAEIDPILQAFRDNLETRNYDAEQELLDALFNAKKNELLALALRSEDRIAEVLWLKGSINKLRKKMQNDLAKNAAGSQAAVSGGAPQALPAENAFQEGIAKRDASADGLTLTTLLEHTTDAVRQMQGLHYSPLYRSAVELGLALAKNKRFDSPRVQEFIALFEQLGAGVTQDAMSEVTDKNPIEDRVIRWLQGFVEEMRRLYPDEPAYQTTTDAILLIANLAVPDMDVVGVNKFRSNGNRTTLLQVMLKKSIAIEEYNQRGAREDDAINKKITRFKRLTRPEKDHSTTANRAMIAVFGDVPMYRLTGRASDGVGGHLTPNQLVQSLLPLNARLRKRQAYKWRRQPAYLKPLDKKHDPPYTLQEFTTGNVSAFTMMMDAIIAEGSAVPSDMERRDATSSKKFRTMHASLKTMRDEWYEANYRRLLKDARKQGEDEVSDERVLIDLLESNPQIAQMITDIVPEAAHLGMVHMKDGTLWTARWLQEVLLEKKAEKAELMLFVHSRFAELNVMGGKLRFDSDIKKTREKLRAEGKSKKEAAKLAPFQLIDGVDPRMIKSRFLEVVYRIASEDQTGFELDRLLQFADEAKSLDQFLGWVNSESNWVGDQQELLKYYDDVADFNPDISAVWSTGGTTGQQQREALQMGADRLSRMSKTYATSMADAKEDRRLLKDLYKYFDKGIGGDDTAIWAGRLQKLLANAAMIPDIIGVAARDQFMEMVQQGLPRVQDKAKTDEAADPMGSVTTHTVYGYHSGISQELSAQTSADWDAVMSNLSGLAADPVRVMLADGSYLVLDFSLVEGDDAHNNEVLKNVTKLLMDPRTRNFAMAVLAPTTRDVDRNNVIQHYTRVSTNRSDLVDTPFKAVLTDTSFGHLFPRKKMGVLTDDQAVTMMGMVESMARKAALDGTEEERDDAENIIQKRLTEFQVAGLSSDDNDRDPEGFRQDLRRNYMTVMQNIALLSPERRADLRRFMERRLRDRYLSRDTIWTRLGIGPFEARQIDRELKVNIAKSLQARVDKLLDDANALPASSTQAERDAIFAEISDLQDRMEKNNDQAPLHDRIMALPPSVAGAIHMFTVGINDVSNPKAQGEARLAMLEYLNTGGRINRYNEKGGYILLHKVRSALKNDETEIVRSNKIEPKDWDTLAYFAASTAIAESAASASHGVGLLPMKPDDTKLMRFYDRSGAYLLDGLLDEGALAQVKAISSLAQYEPIGISFDQILDQVDNLMFSDRKIGKWTQLVVTENAKDNKALLGSTVHPALQRGGIAPTEWRDAVAAGWVSTALPEQDPNKFEEHHTRLQLNIPHTLQDPGTLVGAFDGTQAQPWEYMKLEHHFIPPKAGPDQPRISVTIKGQTFDWTEAVTEEFIRDTSVVDSGYRLFRGDLFQEKLEELQRQHGSGTYQVLIDFVDVDKKPHTPEFVNSVYFDGAGRGGTVGMGPGAISDMLFGTGAISKETQQQPLDFAAKAGKLFWQIVLSKYNNVRTAEQRDVPLAEILFTKAAHMWGKEYESGHLMLGDNNALYKLMKQRHVVRGRVAGAWQYMWAEDVIQRQTKNLAAGKPMNEGLGFEKDEFQLIPLSLAVSQTLLGRGGMQGTKAALTMPELNLQDQYTFPSLDNERLRELGLTNLGDEAKLANSAFAAVQALPPAPTSSKGRGKPNVSIMQSRYIVWQGEVHTIHGNRQLYSKELHLDDTPTGNRAFGKEQIRTKTRNELLAPILAELPFEEMQDMSAVHLSDRLEKMIDRILGPSSAAMIWVHRHSETPDVTRGILGRASMNKQFGDVSFGKKKVGPVYGDVVVIDLDDLVAGGRAGKLGPSTNHDQEVLEAQKIIRAYAKRGVTIVLGGEASSALRGDLAMWMRSDEGGLGYQAMKNSMHYFEPMKIVPTKSKDVDALESTLDEVRYYSARGLNLQFMCDDEGIFASENAVLFDHLNASQITFKRVTNVLMPASLVGSFRGHRAMFNLPRRGTGSRNEWNKLRTQLRRVLDDPERIKHLKKMSGGDNGNPKDVPLREKRADGKWSGGVLSFDEAMARLKTNLKTGDFPADVGKTLLPGDFYVVMSAKGEPLLLRYGFQIPKGLELMDQLKAPVEGVPFIGTGRSPVGVGIAVAKLEEAQTVPPPIRIRRLFNDRIGLRMESEYDTAVMTKSMLQQLGFKAGYAPMPKTLAFPDETVSRRGMLPGSKNRVRINTIVSEQAMDSKQATYGSIRNLREAFLLTGMDFQRDMVEFFFGKGLRTQEQYDDQLNVTKMILNAWANESWGDNVDKEQLSTLLGNDGILHLASRTLNGIGSQLIGTEWKPRDFLADNRQDPEDPSQRIALCILATLMMPGIRPEHVLATHGLLTVEDRFSETLLMAMPPFLTQALDNPRYGSTRDEIFKRINDNAAWPTEQITVAGKNGAPDEVREVPLYWLDPDYTFKIRMRNPETGEVLLKTGSLQRVLPLPFEKDAASLEASQLSQKTNVSPHVAAVFGETISAYTAAKPGRITKEGQREASDLEILFGGAENRILTFEDEESSFHEIFARVRNSLETYSPWERRLPLQQKYMDDAEKKMASYNRVIDKIGRNLKTGKKEPWSPDAEKLAVQFLNRLGLGKKDLYEVDILVRQFVGRPGARKKGEDDEIDEGVYRQVVSLMLDNVNNFLHPLHGGAVPMESESFWSKVYHAQKGKGKDRWAPEAKGTFRKHEFPDSWEGWVHTLIGQVKSSNAPFHGMFRMDLDGFFHTFQGTTPTFNSMAISMDDQRDLMLMDAETNAYVLSLDQWTEALWSSPIIMPTMEATLNVLTGHDSDIVGQQDAWEVPGGSLAEQLERQNAWLKGQKMARQKRTSVRKYYQEGLAYSGSSQNTHNAFANLNNLQVFNRLANPGLYFSALMEVPWKNMLEHMTNIATGRYVGRGSTLVSGQRAAGELGRGTRMAQGAQQGMRKLLGGAEAEGNEKVMLRSKFTPEEQKALRQLAKNMGSKTEWRAELFGELLYKDLVRRGLSKSAKHLENLTATVARMTGDPTIGMTAKSAAQRYNDAALEYLMSIDSSISVEQYIRLMTDDPLWLQKQSGKTGVSAHSVGINRVAATRGTRQSSINRMAFGWIDRLENGDTWTKQFSGFLLNVPFRFKRFNVGTFLSLTGLDGFDQMFAMMRDKRPDNGVIGRLQAAMRGEAYVPNGVTDYSDVIEGIDLTRAFVRGGMAQTRLLAAGLWMGELGLDGEDEETRRRRRMKEYLDAAYLYDPRDAQNDFLYADALFLDSVPVLDKIFQDEEMLDENGNPRSIVVPHWIIKQFTSPMMGIQRFINTGDFREVMWGFQDAISVVPYSALNLWEQSVEAVHLLNIEAEQYAAENGETPETQGVVTQLLINAGAVLEKALLENSFVNAVRSGADQWDRDPYQVVKKDANGKIVFENGLPAQTDTLVSYPVLDAEGNPTGEIKQGYEKRPLGGISGARSHNYAENNLSWAILASLFTGQIVPGESTFKRNNMLVKEQKLQVPVSSQEEAEALILAAYMNKGGQEFLTMDEIIRALKFRDEQAGVTWDQGTIEAEARAVHEANSGAMGGLSALDADGNEVLTQAGAHSIYRGLMSGTVDWNDAVLDGVVIPPEMREKIAEEWLTELVQWGVNTGMSEQSALYYARRIWDGDKFNPDAPSLSELLYDKRIPWEGTVKYRQLNMTYMIGPDGRPWATPFQRQNVLQAFGVPVPHRMPANAAGMSKDIRGKSVDDVLGINTGLHGLVPEPFKPLEPPEDLFDKVAEKTYTPGNYTRYPRRGYGGGGGGGGGYFTRLEPFSRGAPADLPTIPMLNTSNPYIRRARLNRQRITSERERLKQWQ